MRFKKSRDWGRRSPPGPRPRGGARPFTVAGPRAYGVVVPQLFPTWASPTAPARLLVDGVDSGMPLWVTRNRKERNAGLLGTDGLDGALWIRGCNWIHTFGMRHTILTSRVTLMSESLSNCVFCLIILSERFCLRIYVGNCY